MLSESSVNIETKIVVKEFNTVFVYDPNGKVVFTESTYLTIEIIGARKEVEEQMFNEKQKREVTAAQQVANELQQLMKHARGRGLSPALSFAHFDTERTGFIDVPMLINGCAKLGIGVTQPVGELVLQLIGGIGSTYLNMRDLEGFINNTPDLEVFEKFKKGSSSSKSSLSQKLSASASNTMDTTGGQDRSEASSRRGKSRLRATSSVDNSRHENNCIARQQRLAHTESMNFDDENEGIPQDEPFTKPYNPNLPPSSNPPLMELPAPLAAYSINRPKEGAMDLPPWATKRQKRALREMQRTHETWRKKEEEEAAESLLPAKESQDIEGEDELKYVDSRDEGDGDAVAAGTELQRHDSSQSVRRPLSRQSSRGDTRTGSRRGSRTGSRGGSRGGNKSRGGGRPDLPAVPTLQNLSEELLTADEANARACQDDMLHVDHGVMMTFRVVKGRGSNQALKLHEENRDLLNKSKLEVRQRNLQRIVAENEEEPVYGEGADKIVHDGMEEEGKDKKWVTFTIVVIPDLFMTTDTMGAYLDPIVQKYPLARIVLVGLPGLPYTHWPRGWVLNADLHARSIAVLLNHLKTSNNTALWSPIPDEPVVFMAFGTGMQSLSRFVYQLLPAMTWLQPHVHAIISVNGYSKMTKNSKRICKELREGILTATAPEVNELVTSLHFFDDFLAREGRDETLKKFWSTRRGMIDKSKLPNPGMGTQTTQNLQHAGMGYKGVLEQLRGLLIGPDDPEALSSFLYTKIPLMVIQCTEDVFVEPQVAAQIFSQKNLDPFGRRVVEELDDFLSPGAVYMNWIRGGHEIIQERGTFLLACLSNVAQQLGLRPMAEDRPDDYVYVNPYDVETNDNDNVDMEEIMKNSSGGHEEEKKALDNSPPDEESKEVFSNDNLMGVFKNALEKKKEDEIEAKQEVVETKSSIEQESENAKDDDDDDEDGDLTEEKKLKKNERRAKDKAARKANIEIRQKRDEENRRQQEMDALHEKQRKFAEKKQRLVEMNRMAREDELSLFAMEYQYEVEQQVKHALVAREKSQEIMAMRRAQAVKKVEDTLALERSRRLEERRMKSEQLTQQMEAEELTLSGQKEGGYDASPDDGAKGILLACQRLLRDFMECKQKLMESMKRQSSIEQKTHMFRDQKFKLDNEIRKLRQAIQLISKDSLMSGMGIAKQETEELVSQLGYKEESFREFCMVGTVREEQLASANRSVIGLKNALKSCESLMIEKLQKMEHQEKSYVRQIRQMKMDVEHFVLKKDHIRAKRGHHKERLESLGLERKRLKTHTDKFVDSDVLMEGVMQRVATKTLKKHLKSCYAKCESEIEEFDKEIADIQVNIQHEASKQEKVIRDCNRVSVGIRLFTQGLKMVQKHSLATVLDDLNRREEEAARLEKRRQDVSDVNQSLVMKTAKTLVDKIRKKDPELRDKKERQFVGIDLVLYPDEYSHLSATQFEEMKFDPSYQCLLEQPALERIKKLPGQLALAMPFLSTVDEIHAHRLINFYYREKGEDYYKKADYFSSEPEEDFNASVDTSKTGDSSLMSISSLKDNAIYLTAKEMHEAEIVHDILVKESLRNALRASGPGENISMEEKQYIAMDKILSPELYSSGELAANKREGSLVKSYLENGKLNGADLNYNTFPKSNIDPPKDGDKYDELREKYNNGELLTDFDDIKCPFSRDELMAIRKMDIVDVQNDPNPEVMRCRVLLDKYYVHEDETLYGHRRLKGMQKISAELHSALEEIGDSDDESAVTSLSNEGGGQKKKMNKGEDEEDEEDDDDSVESADDRIKRKWGSWEVIHPACHSVESQTQYFQVANYSCTRDHPASFAVREEADEEDPFAIFEPLDVDDVPEQNFEEKIKEGVEVLTSVPQRSKKKNRHKWLIVKNVEILAQTDPKVCQGKVVLLHSGEKKTLLEEKETTLNARTSRSHKFEIPDLDSCRVLNLCVSITYQGSFGNRGYRLGRIAASLFKLPKLDGLAKKKKNADEQTIPLPIGYTPYDLQTPNLPESFGRIVIVHDPKTKPLSPGTYQLVLGAATTTKYSVEISCNYAQNALSIIDPKVIEAKEMQSRMPICLTEMEDLQEGLRLAERKLGVIRKMIVEAEAETHRCQRSIQIVCDKLTRDDETMEYTEDERRDLMKEQSILEVEFAQWAMIYGTRCKEKADVKEGIKMMHSFNRERQLEKIHIKDTLVDYRRDLPACIALLRSYQEAANVAMTLNTSVQGKGAAVESTDTIKANGSMAARIQTPADIVRRQFKREGWESLTLEEQQWMMLDQSLVPHKYEWLREKEEEDNFKRMQLGKKKKKKKKYNAAIEAYRMDKLEIDQVLVQPFSMLNRHEVSVRKLLTKYHDDPEIIKRKRVQSVFGFDPHRAERTRAKQKSLMSKQELEWSSVDKVLHPEVWAYYHHDDDAKMFLDKAAKGARLAEKGVGGLNVGGLSTRVGTAASTGAHASVSVSSSSSQAPTIESGSASNLSADGETESKEDKPATMASGFAKILDMGDSSIEHEAANRKGSALLGDIARDAHKKIQKENKLNSSKWVCPYSKDKILQIWKVHNPQLLNNEQERHVYKLLQKYNGQYGVYLEMMVSSKARMAKGGSHEGSHVQWDKTGKAAPTDVDDRARAVMRELDRAIANKNFWMDSLVLHTNDQRFPTEVLRVQLEEELDAILMDQVRERERMEKLSAAQRGENDETDSEDEEDSDDSDDDNEGGTQELTMSKVQARAARREKRRTHGKEDTLQQEVHKAKKQINTQKLSGLALEEAKTLNALGVMGCLACRSNPCKWEPTVDEDVCTARKKELLDEIERVRSDTECIVWESTVALSAQLGGGMSFTRQDLLDELAFEAREIDRRIHLNLIDKELHDCYNTRKEYVEVKHLHGYSTVLWVNNARKALSARQDRLVALNIANEVVDDILETMLEGWHFGERESKYLLAGFVPSVKKDGHMKSGQEQVQAVGISAKKAKERRKAKMKGIITPTAMRGKLEEKLRPMENDLLKDMEDKRIAKEGTDHKRRLDTTEQTLKFGLFMLTLMYFRAMTFLSREKKSWGEEDDIANVNKKGAEYTEERAKMNEEEAKLIARQKKMDVIMARAVEGEARKKAREDQERREAILKLQAIVRRQRREKESINCLQRLYRGHLGRKAARRWAMKRAELTAINALMNAAATCLQRVWRGYLARVRAIETRAEMAYFIALMRTQEADTDEKEFWETHPLQRAKRNVRNFVNNQFRADHAFKTLGAPGVGGAFDDGE
jgi:hypothetical protein